MPNGPIASFNIDPNPALCNELVSFDASGSIGNIIFYSWDFGDGSGAGSTEPDTSNHYNSPGFYTVTLIVTDINQDQATTTKTIEIICQSTRGIIL